MKAKNEAAEQFQAKIADEVIPSIRKYGAYLTLQAAEAVLLNPDTIIQLATQIKEEQARRMELRKRLKPMLQKSFGPNNASNRKQT